MGYVQCHFQKLRCKGVCLVFCITICQNQKLSKYSTTMEVRSLKQDALMDRPSTQTKSIHTSKSILKRTSKPTPQNRGWTPNTWLTMIYNDLECVIPVLPMQRSPTYDSDTIESLTSDKKNLSGIVQHSTVCENWICFKQMSDVILFERIQEFSLPGIFAIRKIR